MQYSSNITMVTVHYEFSWEVLGYNTVLGLVVQVPESEIAVHSSIALQ